MITVDLAPTSIVEEFFDDKTILLVKLRLLMAAGFNNTIGNVNTSNGGSDHKFKSP